MGFNPLSFILNKVGNKIGKKDNAFNQMMSIFDKGEAAPPGAPAANVPPPVSAPAPAADPGGASFQPALPDFAPALQAAAPAPVNAMNDSPIEVIGRRINRPTRDPYAGQKRVAMYQDNLMNMGMQDLLDLVLSQRGNA